MILEISAGSRVFDRSRRSLFRLRLSGGESREVTFRASGSVTSGSAALAGFDTSWGRTIAVGVISENTGGTRFWSEKAEELSILVATEEDEVTEEELPRVELGGGGFFGGKLVISAPGWSEELEIELDLEPFALMASSSVSIQFRRIFSVKAPIVSDFSAELIMKQAYLFFSPS